MPGTDTLARLLITFGVALVVLGGLLLLVGRLPGMGRLPGDIVVQRDGFSLYVPLVSMLLLSLVVTVLLNVVVFLSRR